MTVSDKEKYSSQLFNQLSLSFKSELFNENVKDIFSLLNSLSLKFDFIEVDKDSKLLTTKGIWGGSANYYIEKKEYEIVIKVYNSLEIQSWESCINYILSSSTFDIINKKLSFVYLHEMLHIFQKHLINHERYEQIAHNLLKENNNKIDKNIKLSELLNIAFDYHINSIIYNTGLFSNLFIDEKKIDFLFNKEYNAKNMSELDILKDLIQNSKIKKEVFNELSLIKLQITPKNEKTKEIIIDIDVKSNNDTNIDSNNMEDQISALNTVKSKAKGNGSFNIMEKLGLPIEVEISWIDRLQTKVNNISYLYSKKTKETWSKLNIFYKNTNLPGRKKIKLNKEAYILIDYSSSMPNTVIRKINYVLLKLVQKKINLNIISHTDKITEINKISSTNKDIKDFIKTRKVKGGTSHKEPFNYLEKNIKGKLNLIIILSDMCSDIELIYNKYTFQKKSQLIYVDTKIDIDIKFQQFCINNNATYIHI